MKKLLVIGGGTAFRRYVLDVQENNKLKGVYRKVIRQRDKTGKVIFEKPYYYRKFPRDEKGKQELIAQGYDPKHQLVRYAEEYVGAERPAGYREDDLSRLKKEGFIELRGKELITDRKTYDYILSVAGEYFIGLEYYVLQDQKGGDTHDTE